MSASKAPTSQSLEEMFGEPISVYTDAQAVEDGFIVDLAKFTNVRFLGLPINRTTRHLYDDLEPFAKTEAETLYNGSIGRALASILSTKIRFAQGDPGDTGEVGGISIAFPRSYGWCATKSASGPPCTRKTTDRVAKSESGRKTSRSLFFLLGYKLGSGLYLRSRLFHRSRRCLLLRFQFCPPDALRCANPSPRRSRHGPLHSLQPSCLQLRPPRALGRCDLAPPRG
jgi:hypothetical protein